MERIYSILQEIGYEEEQLPMELQKRIDALDARTEAFNELLDSLEAEGLSEEEINERTTEEDDNLEEIEEGIVESIIQFHEQNVKTQNQYQGGGYIPPSNMGKKPEAEKKSNDGWFLFGAFALVVTLGAVNMFKK